MNETSLLSGKVLKRSLPVIQGRPANDAPRLKRLLLAQGELAQIYDGLPGVQYLAYVALVKDAVRGNHFHQRKNESIYIITGRIALLFQDVSTGETASTEAGPGDLVVIPAAIAHAFKTLESGHALEFSPEPFDPVDIFPHALKFDVFGPK